MNDRIFGYSWEDIQQAQQGGKLQSSILGECDMPQTLQSDLNLLKKHGKQGLYDLGFHGVIDKLTRSGHIS